MTIVVILAKPIHLMTLPSIIKSVFASLPVRFKSQLRERERERGEKNASHKSLFEAASYENIVQPPSPSFDSVCNIYVLFVCFGCGDDKVYNLGNGRAKVSYSR